jgi:hypothetical protein
MRRGSGCGAVPKGDEKVRRNISISRDLDLRLRKAVLERSGLEKGDLSEAISEAIELWLKKHG